MTLRELVARSEVGYVPDHARREDVYDCPACASPLRFPFGGPEPSSCDSGCATVAIATAAHAKYAARTDSGLQATPLGANAMARIDDIDSGSRAMRLGRGGKTRIGNDLLIDMEAAMVSAGEDFDYPLWPLAARGFLTLLVGRHSSFKTWLMLLAGHAVHRGAPGIAGMTCSRTPVLYVDAENGPRLMGKRFRDAGVPADGLLVGDGGQLTLPKDLPCLAQLISDTGAGLVVLDSLRRLAPGAREDRSDDMAPIMAAIAKLARDCDTAIVLIHHRSSKNGSATVRGSSTIEDQADLLFSLEHVSDDTDRNRRRLRAEKFRIDTAPEDVWLSLGPTPDVSTGTSTVTLTAADPVAGGAASGGQSMADFLIDRIRLLAPQVGPEGWPPRQLATAIGRAQDDRSFKTAIGTLVADGEWIAEGQTRARRYRPAGSGHSGLSRMDDRGLNGSAAQSSFNHRASHDAPDQHPGGAR